MTDELDLKLARECAAEVAASHVAPFASAAIRAGKCDGHITVRSALLAIKAERAQTVAWLRRIATIFETAEIGAGLHEAEKPIATIRQMADDIERGELGE